MTKLPDPASAPSPPAAAASEPASDESNSRRDFMAEAGAIGIGAVVGLTPFVAGAITFLDPLGTKKYPAKASGEASFVTLTRLDNLVDGGAPQQVPVRQDKVDAWTFSPQEPVGAVYLVRKGDDVVCFNAVCPHAGCFVGFDAAQQRFVCPCHNSAFDLYVFAIREAGGNGKYWTGKDWTPARGEAALYDTLDEAKSAAETIPAEKKLPTTIERRDRPDGTAKREKDSPSERDLDMLDVEVDKTTGEVKVKFQNFLTGKQEKIPR